MRSWLLISAVGLAACSGATDSVDAPPPQDGVDVREVVATLRIEPEALQIDGLATLTVRHPSTLATLDIGLDDALELQGVRVNRQPVQATRDGDALAIPLSGGDSSVVEIAYQGVPVSGVYRDDSEGQTVVYTDGWPDRTAGWLPTVHHSSDASRFDLSLDIPVAWEAVASGIAVLDSVAAGRRHTRFVLDEDSPPYTFAFALADFTLVEETETVQHALLAGNVGLASRLERTGAALDTLAMLFGPYPYARYTTVQVPMRFAGMENVAAPFLRADLYRADVPGRNAIEEVNWHELVHQWWGNAVVPADWIDLWLAEGPATYFTADLYARLDGEDAGRRHLALMVRQLERADARFALVPGGYDDPADMLSPTVYQKGGAVLHTLRLVIGDDAFWSGFRAIQTDFADRPLSTAAFQSAFEAASGQDLNAFFGFWVYGDTVPVLDTHWDRPTRTLSWEIEGDSGTLAGVPFELMLLQDGEEVVALATDGVASLPGDSEPDVWPVGVLVEVQ
ncbi:MAG: M1 family metallopeptidase [Rubricoccaceae bacterium]